MNNKELLSILEKRIQETERKATDEAKYRAYCDMIGQDDADGVYFVAFSVIADLLSGLETRKLEVIARLTGLDPTNGVLIHRSHRKSWEIHAEFWTSSQRTIVRKVVFVPWEGAYPRLPDDTHNGLYYVPELEGVEDPRVATDIIYYKLTTKA